MLAAERRDLILGRLETEGSVLVSELSAEFEVSEETIRRDLEKLENDGYARRCYGGASFAGGQELPFSARQKSNVSGKTRIAAAVADLIQDGAYIALDGSSTSTFVAQALHEKKGLTVITNSLEVALLLSDKEDFQVLMAGGLLKPHDLTLTGPRSEAFIHDFHVDWAVISCKGMDLHHGASDVLEDNARIKRAMTAIADRTILAADSRKFDRRSFAGICGLETLDFVVTDEEPRDEWKNVFRESGITLICNIGG